MMRHEFSADKRDQVPPRRKRTALLAAAAVSILMIGAGIGVLSMAPIGAVLAQATKQAPASASTQPAPATVFDEHVRQGNIVRCKRVFSVLGLGVAGDSTYTAQTRWDSKAGDAHSIQSIVALDGGLGNPEQRAAGVVFAAPVGSACEGTLVRVTPTTDSCQTVSTELTKQNGRTGTLGSMGLVAMPNGAEVMLVPAGAACVAVTTLRGVG